MRMRSQQADRRHIRDRVGVVDVMPVGHLQRRARDLVHADEQLRRVLGRQHLLDEPVDLRVAEGVDVAGRFSCSVSRSRSRRAASA